MIGSLQVNHNVRMHACIKQQVAAYNELVFTKLQLVETA
jgi:hypothetical protein